MIKIDVKADKLTIDLSQIKLKDFVDLAQKEMHNTKARLESNLSQGKDANGKGLPGYSESYKEQIRRNRARGGTGKTGPRKTQEKPVNLLVTGEMRRSRKVKKISNGAELGFHGSHAGTRLSNSALAGVQLGMRPGWHEFGKKDIERIQKSLDKLVDEKVKKLIKVTKNT